MAKQKILLFMIDALCDIDVDVMRKYPNFKYLLDNGALVKHMHPVYPSFTYPCHTSIMTGCYPDKHGIPHNERVKPGVYPVPWYCERKDIKKKLFVEYAKDSGYSTCILNWPVSAGADVDINLPMCTPYKYDGDDPAQFYKPEWATKEVVDRYFWKYGHLLCHMATSINNSLDSFTFAVAPDIIRDYGQPDVMFVKMCDLDTIRHQRGVVSEEANEQLHRHDCQLGVLMESVRRYGDFENTNFIVIGDHGQSDVAKTINMNKVFQDNGLQQLDENGKLVSYEAYCHSTGASGWVELRQKDNEEMRTRVYNLLKSCKDIGIDYVFTKEEAKEKYHLTGPFDFVIESAGSISFNFDQTDPLFIDNVPNSDYKVSPGTHGGLPERDHCTTFFAAGPAFKKGAVLDTATIVDEAPTMAEILGFKMDDVDGRVMTELLK